MSKTIAIVPARAGSKGVKNKNIRELAGKPLVYWSVRAAIDASFVYAVALSTESDTVSGALWSAMTEEEKSRVFMYKRPQELAQDHVQVDEVTLFTMRQMEGDLAPETIVVLQPTSPFRTAEEIDRAVSMHQMNDGVGTVVSGYEDRGYYWKETERDRSKIAPINHDPSRRLGRQWRDPYEYFFRENGAIYVISASELSLHRINRVPPFTPLYMDEKRSIDIDTEEDWAQAKEMEHLLLASK